MVVLDTHVWIWLINGDDKIKNSGLLTIINKALKNSSIYIPAISLWEAAMLAYKDRITFSENTLEWIKMASSAPGISVYPITPEIAFESTALPGRFHGDPADRLIVATTRIINGTLLTFDKKIIDYAGKGFVKIARTK